MKKQNNCNLTEGPIFKTLLVYSFPIIITNVIQLLFHTIDVTILAMMVDDLAVAAVGACGSLITLLVGIFTGFSTGSNVLVARRIGEGNKEGVQKAIGSSMTIGFVSGGILMIIGMVFAKDFLVLTNCQPDVLDAATSYLIAYFSGMPVIMLYNFVASVFRAKGDSVRPMRYMLISGILKIGLNIFFIGALGLSVVGVAVSTVISNLISLLLAIKVLLKEEKEYPFELPHLMVKKGEFSEIVKVGVPTCLCSIFFYIANVILSSAVNSISTDAMTANAISSQFDAVIYNVGCSIAIATSVIVGQNFGAKHYERIRKTMRISIGFTTLVSLGLGIIFVLLSDLFLGFMTKNPHVIEIAKEKMTLLCLTYFITSIMEIYSFSLRTINRSNTTMVVGGICGLGIRGAWAWFIWPLCPTLPVLFQSYAVSAFVATMIYIVVYQKRMKQAEQKFGKSETGGSL